VAPPLRRLEVTVLAECGSLWISGQRYETFGQGTAEWLSRTQASKC